MTCREKLKLEHPECSESIQLGGCEGCPGDYGYLPEPTGASNNICSISCDECWDREIPEEKIVPLKADDNEPKRGLRSKSPVIIDELHEVSNEEEPHIKDSGDRTEFPSGAVRDMREGKGRCDLAPLDVIGYILDNPTICYIANFQQTGNFIELRNALTSSGVYHDPYTMFLEVAKHFEEGAKKYGESNWQKGIPVHCYIDSAVRHYLKYLRGDKDEPHDRAFCWNILCCIWTCNHMPELNIYAKEKNE